MTLQSYSIINAYLILFIVIGLILPALIIYFNSSYKNYFALIISAITFGVLYFAIGWNIIILLPLIISILLSGFLGSYLRQNEIGFWQGMGYLIATELIGIMLGMIIIYFSYGRQDIIELIIQGFKSAYSSTTTNDIIVDAQLNVLTILAMMTPDNALTSIDTVASMGITEKIETIIPLFKESLASLLPSFIMGYGLISGISAWWISSLLFARRVRQDKQLKGIKNFNPPPVFSSWKAPRWLTNIMLLLLFSAMIIQLASIAILQSAAIAIQNVVIIVISLQGLAVINWWLKRKKVNHIIIIVISSISVIFLSFTLPWIGLADIIFSVRTLDRHKEIINKNIKNQTSEQGNPSNINNDKNNENNSTNNEKDANDDSTESEEK